MSTSALCPATAASQLLGSLVFAAACSAGTFETTVNQEVSAGGMIRVGRRDPGLVGGGNGGTGTSINYDDGNLNYGRGLTSLGIQGRTLVDGRSSTRELRIEAVYFYDFINTDGRTDFRPLSGDARDQIGRASCREREETPCGRGGD